MQWLQDSDYAFICPYCSKGLAASNKDDLVRLHCLDLVHRKCLEEHVEGLGELSTLQQYKCPSCSEDLVPRQADSGLIAQKFRDLYRNAEWFKRVEDLRNLVNSSGGGGSGNGGGVGVGGIKTRPAAIYTKNNDNINNRSTISVDLTSPGLPAYEQPPSITTPLVRQQQQHVNATPLSMKRESLSLEVNDEDDKYRRRKNPVLNSYNPVSRAFRSVGQTFRSIFGRFTRQQQFILIFLLVITLFVLYGISTREGASSVDIDETAPIE